MDERENRARLALIDAQFREFERKVAYERHLKACAWVDTYNLPYRVSMDYMKRYGHHSGVVLINPCYPLPGYPAAELLTLSHDDLDTDNPDVYRIEQGRRVYLMKLFDTPKEEVRQRVEQHNKRFRPWDLDTDDGRRVWELEFAHFLTGYDIDAFSMFDMFGRMDADETALRARKRYYKGVLDRFNSGNGAYRTSEPPYLPGYEEQYTAQEYLISLLPSSPVSS